MNLVKLKTHIISEELFQFALVTYLILILSETVKTGFVSNFFNLNILLAIVLFVGILMVMTNTEYDLQLPAVAKKITSADVQNIILLAVGGGLLVFYKTQDLGKISIIISVMTMGIIMLLSFLVLAEGREITATIASHKPHIVDHASDAPV